MIRAFQLCITLRAPWLTKDNQVGLFGVDAPLARLPDDRFYFPGTLIVGKLKEAVRELAPLDNSMEEIRAAFFSGNDKTPENALGWEARRRILIGDLILEQNAHRDGLRTRIAIDASRNTASDGALQVIEAPMDSGEAAHFSGMIWLLGTETECANATRSLEKALQWLTQIGGGRTIGHGVVSCLSLTATAMPKVSAVPTAGNPRLKIRISAQTPLCVGEKRISPNSYECSGIISGGVIKGALAQNILASNGIVGATLAKSAKGFAASKDLAANFSELRITHAFPVPKGKTERPKRAPLSLAYNKGKDFADWTKLRYPENALPSWSFAGDWKPERFDERDALTQWSMPGKDFRIRTAINEERRASDEARLFAVSYSRPDTHDWVAYVDAPNEETLDQLQAALAEGLFGVGRGGAYCRVSFETDEAPEVPGLAKGNRLILTLQTPALLRNPKEETVCVTEAYRTAFKEIGIEGLISVFVQEQLHGAQFFAKRLPVDTVYKPWLLTQAGSTFVFKVGEDANAEELKNKLQTVLSSGLQIPPTTAEFYSLKLEGDAWRYCPYLPENGYGEAAIEVLSDDQLTDAPVKWESWS
jgi:CRISPR-associated protein (Cas_Cmr3)